MKNPLIRLKEMRREISGAERNAAEYLLANSRDVLECNIRELAAKIYVSPSTIVRLCQRLGFDGYKEFRQAVVYELALYQSRTKTALEEFSPDDSLKEIAEKVTYRNIKSLEETHNLLDLEELEACVRLISSAENIFLFGIGASFSVAKDAYLKFLRVGKNCHAGEDWHVQQLYSKNAKPTDVGIVISYSGETMEMIECTKNLIENHVPIVSITRFAASRLVSMSDHVLYTSDSESIFRVGAISSRTAQLNMIDMLYMSYISLNYDACMKYLRKTHIKKLNE